MKKAIILIIMLLPVFVIGQTTTENYNKTILYQTETIDGIVEEYERIENVHYYDGLGNLKQSIAVLAGGNGRDIIQHYEYDQYGRKQKEYLPYAKNPDFGRIDKNPMNGLDQFYRTEKYEYTTNEYAQNVFAASPQNKILEKAAPGADWKYDPDKVSYSGTRRESSNHTIKYEYQTNIKDEVPYFDVNFINNNIENPTLVRNGFYEKNELYKTIIKDENWQPGQIYGNDHTVEEFKDLQGRLIQKYVFDGGEAHGTYYVYDDFGNLTFVIPPKVIVNDGVSDIELNELCYQYRYDYRNRLIEKKVPGKGWEHIVYDELDRPVLTQYANQRKENSGKPLDEWLFTKYDVFGRVAYTGMVKSNNTRKQIQEYYEQNANLFKVYETKTETPQIIAGTTIYYKSKAKPLRVDEIYTINYYDDYAFDLEGSTNPGVVYNQNITTNTKTLATGSKVKVLDTDKWITTVHYYDDKARSIYEYTNNDYLKTTNTISTKLDFVGKVIESTTTHQRLSNALITTIDRFTYDHVGRLLTQKQTIDNQQEELIVSNTYDELGMLVKKGVGGATNSNIRNLVNVIIEPNQIIKKNVLNNAWNTGFSSKFSIQADGAVVFEVAQTNKDLMVGLSKEDNDVDFKSIDYAIYTTSGEKIQVREKGIVKGNLDITYKIGDLLSVERAGNAIVYKKNNEVFYTSATPSNGNLIGDVSMFHINSRIKNFRLINPIIKSLQTIDYEYNIRGWLKQINDPNALLGDDLFAFKINYNTTNVVGSKPLYNGNISETHWKTANDNVKKHYVYGYDALDRITKGVDNTGRYNLTNVAYDKNGNILNLTRQGWKNGVSYANMDRLFYTYDAGNKLTKVVDTGNDNYGFKDGTNTNNDYEYDSNGNMTVDHNKGITNIQYNYLNLPTVVTINGKQIRYIYDATGVKLTKSANGVFTHYDGGYVYEGPDLQFFKHSEGYVEPNTNGSFDYVYQYKDHLDNIRLSYSDTNNDGTVTQYEIREENNYYPFGLKHKGYNEIVRGRNHKYGFGGKEEQEEHGLDWIDITARNYDPALGRWMNLDPLAELMRRHSPYNYGFDNPVYFIDPDGMIPFPNNEYDENPLRYIARNREASSSNDSTGVPGCPKCDPRARLLDEVTITGSIYDDVLNTDNLPKYTIKEDKPNLFGKIKNSIEELPVGSSIVMGFYNLIDDGYISFGQVGRNRYNLEGYGLYRNEITDAGVNTMINILPYTKALRVKGLKSSQFSKLLKGTHLNKLLYKSNKIRGLANKGFNYFYKRHVDYFIKQSRDRSIQLNEKLE
ncbi:DUF6443 domain-containing protein [Aquimarina algiphila]|uniref:DUF6443 domain-containing protein n=1 Tax=Aquimarina algiphila TaxID=2047982 RepID=UPI00232D8A9D|nr:DUF6443 domain-containing protein [Aquimarina algiphila]